MSKLSRSNLAAVIGEQSLKTKSTRELSREIAAYLLEQGRVAELESLLRDVMQYRADRGIVEVIASSAHPLTAEVKTKIQRETRKLYPQAKQIIISPEQDDDLVGGVRLEFANEQLDLTIRATLNRFKQLTTA